MAGKYLFGFLYFLVVLLVGFILGLLWNSYSDSGITGFAVSSPSDFIDNKEIIIYPDRVVIKIENASLSSYDSTGSMKPTLDEGVNGITVTPQSEEEINVGDIVSFRRGENLIVHRVIEKGVDEEGIYFITKGDNSLNDDGKIRFEEIERKVVALVY